jgi:peptidyl-tRNA hydrolase
VNTDDELRLYLVMRGDLDIPYGKGLVQAGHAFTNLIERIRRLDPAKAQTYLESPLHPKIALNAKNENAFNRVKQELEEANIPLYVVTDFGFTVFDGHTVTCLAAGPMLKSEMPPFMRKLQLIR